MDYQDEFDEQFNQVKTISFDGQEIQVWDLTPLILRKDCLPLLFIPGWGSSPQVYKDGLRIYFEAGRRVITLAFTPKVKPLETPQALNLKASIILHLLKESGINKVDAAGHSEGGLLLELIHREECLFRNFIFQAPAGMTGAEPYLKLAWMEGLNALHLLYSKYHATEKEKERMRNKSLVVKDWIHEAGWQRSWNEGILPGIYGGFHLIDKIHNCNNQHQVAIIAAKSDQMIPYKKLLKKAEEMGIKHIYTVDGGHQTFEIHCDKCAILTENILETLEANV